MSRIFEKIEDIKKADLSKKEIKIIDISGNLAGQIKPIAVESCMNPGTFNTKPLNIYVENDNVVFDNGKEKLIISVAEFKNKTVRVQADDFIPKPVKAKSHCTNCTNCGRCSW